MAKNTVKKVDEKKVAKVALSKRIEAILADQGLSVESGEDYGFSVGTLVVHLEKLDVQVKFITTKAGITRYKKEDDGKDDPNQFLPGEVSV